MHTLPKECMRVLIIARITVNHRVCRYVLCAWLHIRDRVFSITRTHTPLGFLPSRTKRLWSAQGNTKWEIADYDRGSRRTTRQQTFTVQNQSNVLHGAIKRRKSSECLLLPVICVCVFMQHVTGFPLRIKVPFKINKRGAADFPGRCETWHIVLTGWGANSRAGIHTWWLQMDVWRLFCEAAKLRWDHSQPIRMQANNNVVLGAFKCVQSGWHFSDCSNI